MTETTLEFTSGVRRAEPIHFNIDGEPYHFIPPKKAVMLLPVMTGEGSATYLWFAKGLNAWDWKDLPPEEKQKAAGLDAATPPIGESPLPPEEWQGAQADRVEARLRDDADNFDVDKLDEIITKLAETVAGRPTT